MRQAVGTAVEIVYSDNVSAVTSERLVQVQDALKTDVVDLQTAKPVTENWGLQEMKVYTRYLAAGQAEDGAHNQGGNAQHLWADGEPRGQAGKNYLQYRWHLAQATTGGNNASTFAHVTNVPDGLGGVLFYLKLVESSLARALLIDERTAAAVLLVSDDNLPQLKPDRYKALYDARIFVCLSTHSPVKPPNRRWLVKQLAASGGPGVARLDDEPDEIEQHEGIRLAEDYATGEHILVGVPATACAAFKAGDQQQFDVIVVHLGWLETRWQTDADREQVLRSLERFASRVVPTSGRGQTGNRLLKVFPFVSYSTVDDLRDKSLRRATEGRHGTSNPATVKLAHDLYLHLCDSVNERKWTNMLIGPTDCHNALRDGRSVATVARSVSGAGELEAQLRQLQERTDHGDFAAIAVAMRKADEAVAEHRGAEFFQGDGLAADSLSQWFSLTHAVIEPLRDSALKQSQ